MKPRAKPAAPLSSHRPIGTWRVALAIAASRSWTTADCMVSVQLILMEFASLHDGGEIFALLLEQSEIFQRVTIDQQQIRASTSLQCPELTLLPDDPCAD